MSDVRKERFNIDLVGMTEVGTTMAKPAPKSKRKPFRAKGKSAQPPKKALKTSMRPVKGGGSFNINVPAKPIQPIGPPPTKIG